MILNEKVLKAYDIIKEYHKGQTRKGVNKVEFITHPIAVAKLVYDLTKNIDMTVAALLHDTLEDTTYTEEQLKEDFGLNIFTMVDNLTSRNDNPEVSKSTYLSLKINKIDENSRLIKLCDRLHNVKSLDVECDLEDNFAKFRKKYIIETNNIISNLIVFRTIKKRKEKLLLSMIQNEVQYLMIKYNIY